MSSKIIEKRQRSWQVVPILLDYEKTCAGFSWDAARRELDGLPAGRGLNIAHEAVDRHANGALRDHLALRWLGKRGEVRDFSLCRPACAHQPLCQCAAQALALPRASASSCWRAHSRTLHQRAGHAEKRQRFLPALFGVRPRADSSTDQHRRWPGSGHHADALQAQGREPARFAS